MSYSFLSSNFSKVPYIFVQIDTKGFVFIDGIWAMTLSPLIFSLSIIFLNMANMIQS
jgi:hypothetical protein